MGSPSGGGTSTTVQKSDPWVGQQPYITQGLEGAQKWYESNQPQYYPFQTYVDWSPQTQAALAAQQAKATQGGGVADTASSMGNLIAGGGLVGANPALGYYNPTAAGASLFANPAYGPLGYAAGGGYFGTNPAESLIAPYTTKTGYENPMFAYLNSMASGGGTNPMLDAMFKQGAGRITDQWNQNILPGLEAAAEKTGNFGSPGMAMLLNREAQNSVGQPISDFATSLYGNAWDRGQANQLAAAQALGSAWQTGQGTAMSAIDQLARLYGGDVSTLLGAAGGVGNLYTTAAGQQAEAAGGQSNAYGNDINAILNTLGMGQNLADLGYYDIGKLGEVGAANESMDTQKLQALMNEWEFGQNKELNKLMQYMQLVGGAGWGGQTTSTTDAQGATNPYASASSVMGGIGAMALPLMMMMML